MCTAILFFVSGCASTPRSTITDRTPAAKAKASVARQTDWRPEQYTVKKGDTLYLIALEHGLDYRELAEWNNIQNVNVIRVGQELRLQPSDKRIQSNPLPEKTAAAVPRNAEIKTQPKALKIPYSDEALAQLQNPVQAPKTESAKTVKAEPHIEQPKAQPKNEGQERAFEEDDSKIDWEWPAIGKTLNENSKGLDIAGKLGQPVTASASGKVVYTGSGIRGYGKLIIIKHNKSYLSAYAHNNEILVKEGQMVSKGQKIAEMGKTDADQVKLHFEIRHLGKPVDPGKYLPDGKTS